MSKKRGYIYKLEWGENTFFSKLAQIEPSMSIHFNLQSSRYQSELTKNVHQPKYFLHNPRS